MIGQNTFSQHCDEIVLVMWLREKYLNHIFITMLNQLYLAYFSNSAEIISNFFVNSCSHLHEKVVEMWWVDISAHFLALIIWKFPPWETSWWSSKMTERNDRVFSSNNKQQKRGFLILCGLLSRVCLTCFCILLFGPTTSAKPRKKRGVGPPLTILKSVNN